MRLATISINGVAQPALVVSSGVIPFSQLISLFDLPSEWLTDMKSIIQYFLDDMVEWYNSQDIRVLDEKTTTSFAETQFLPLYTNPDKIWGIGLNYADHAADLDEGTPDKFPGSFMRPSTTIIGHRGTVQLPALSDGTTGEGELGIIIGKKCKDVDQSSWLDVVAGFTTIIDMTAEDILRHNPRYLTLSKSFDTYFSFGPVFISAEEFTTEQIMNLEVSTVHNDQVYAKNTVSNMRYPPDYLVAFHSQVMTLLPGDIISTGTPRAVKIHHGDRIGCFISGMYSLYNEVRRSNSPSNDD